MPGRVRPRLGAHLSVAGGLPKAVERAVVHGCEAFQIFTKNANQWRGRAIDTADVETFRAAVAAAGLGPVVSHASYLINLAASEPALRRRSLDAMADEIDRAEALGLLGVVVHPGAYTTGGVEQGLDAIAAGLLDLLGRHLDGRTMVILEHTAGQGTSLGASFEQLAGIIERTNGHPRLGVCLDTCHLLASGYDIVSAAGYRRTFEAFERLLGCARLKVFHLNDSKRPIGSRVDRHEHIGQGFVGIEPFRRILNDRRFAGLPMLLETPKGRTNTTASPQPDPLDVKNLARLRALLG